MRVRVAAGMGMGLLVLAVVAPAARASETNGNGPAAPAALPPAALCAGATRGGLNIVLPYYPPTVRAAGMGLATVALEGVDSHNPAALGFHEGFDVVLDYGRVDFQHGPDLDIYHGHVVAPMPVVGGAVKLMGFGISTRNEDNSRIGGRTHVWAREFGFAFGRQLPLPDAVPGRVAFGMAGFPSDPSEVRIENGLGSGAVCKGRGQSKLGSIRVGFMYIPIETLSLGIQYTHIKDYLRQSLFGGSYRSNANYFVNLWTFGLAFRPDEKTVVLVQHMTGRASGTGVHANYDVFSIGIERLVPVTDNVEIALRIGAHDTNMTYGIGVNLPGGWRVDYAFLHHYGEQLAAFFGRGPMHMIGAGKSF